MPPERACERVGISRSTYCEWIAKGEAEPEGPYGDFPGSVRRALAEFLYDSLRFLKDARAKPSRETNAQTVISVLERRFPGELSRTTSVELSGPGGTPLNVRDVRALSDTELEALAKEAGK
jgi:hypothetical protein